MERIRFIPKMEAGPSVLGLMASFWSLVMMSEPPARIAVMTPPPLPAKVRQNKVSHLVNIERACYEQRIIESILLIMCHYRDRIIECVMEIVIWYTNKRIKKR